MENNSIHILQTRISKDFCSNLRFYYFVKKNPMVEKAITKHDNTIKKESTEYYLINIANVIKTI